MQQRTPALIPPTSAASPDTRLYGAQFTAARAVWVTLFALNLVWFGLALVAQVSTTLHPCVAATCTLTPSQAESFRHLGIGLGTVAAYYVGLPALGALAGLILAVLLFWRRSDDWLALVVGLFLLYPVNAFATRAPATNSVGLLALIQLLSLADGSILYGVFLIFPDGRFVPRWAWLLLVALAVQQAVGTILQAGGVTAATVSSSVPAWLALTWTIAFPILYLSAVAIQVYRYRRVSNARQRQQTKWVVLGVAVALVANVLYWIVLPLTVPPFLPPQSLHAVEALYPVVAYPLYELALVGLPVSFAIAIQRHQLFDVDVLIKRTLIYGSLSVILAALYFSIVLATQSVTQRLTGQGEPTIVIVASTLLIAALFNPLRHRLQAIVDRRFYRSKYDAERTLAAFGETLRTETDVSELSKQLVAVVEETMQTASASLWLRASQRVSMDERTGSNN